MFTIRIMRSLAVLVCVGGLAACQSVPQGDTGGRIDPYRTTEADRRSRMASIPAMLEFSDQVAQRLAYDLSNIPEVRDAPQRLILELGDLLNKTRTPTSDFELIQRRIRSAIMQSQMLRNHFMVVESRARMNQEMARVDGGDQLSARYDPNITYLLQGDFFEAVRVDPKTHQQRSQFYFEFKLTNLARRDIVFLDSYDLGQQR